MLGSGLKNDKTKGKYEIMFMRSDKKKKHRGFAVAIGMLAVYGAYKMVAGVKDACCCKMGAMMNCFKKIGKRKSKCDPVEYECSYSDGEAESESVD